jgi:hypothetical protein
VMPESVPAIGAWGIPLLASLLAGLGLLGAFRRK